MLKTFQNKKQRRRKRKRKGGRQGEREEKGKKEGHKRKEDPTTPRPTYGEVGMWWWPCVVLPGAGLMRKLYTVSKHFNNLNYIWVCGTHHVQTYLKENRGNVSVHGECQHFPSKLPFPHKTLTTPGARGKPTTVKNIISGNDVKGGRGAFHTQITSLTLCP